MNFKTAESWVVLSDVEKSIKSKIEAAGTLLKDWDINIYRGVLTGFNEAFIISGDKRNEIIDNCKDEEEKTRTIELIRPILRGRDIKRYSYDFADLWLINTHNGVKEKGIKPIDINDYPAVKEHLDKYYPQLEKRQDKGETPYNLRNCAYIEDFYKQKIVWARLMRISKKDFLAFPRFSIVHSGVFTLDSLCFFSGKNLDVLINLLNSEYAAYYFFNNIAILDNGGMQMRQQYVENIPLPKLSVIQGDINTQIYKYFKFNKQEITEIRAFLEKKKNEIANIESKTL